MDKIRKTIEQCNAQGRKALSIFITTGFPDKDSFVDLALGIYDAGADIIELGIPFSDPLADGPVIQAASEAALKQGVTIQTAIQTAAEITAKTDKPLILMGYANPILRYGKERFIKEATDAGVAGVIVPDIPVEEYETFFGEGFGELATVLLTTPTSGSERIENIDKKSEGFVYCVSVTGTTGARDTFDENVLRNLDRTYNLINRNKMMIGFGIAKPEDIKTFAPYCDGVIVGSKVIRTLQESAGRDYSKVYELITTLSNACDEAG